MQPIIFFVKPYVKKFIVKNYGKEPVYLRADSDIGKLVRLAISRDNYLPLEELEVEESMTIGRKSVDLVKLKFALSFRVSQGKITAENIDRMTAAIENEFDKAMYYFVRGLRIMKISESRAVKMFLAEYNIEDVDGIKIDTAIKVAQRARAEKEDKAVLYQ